MLRVLLSVWWNATSRKEQTSWAHHVCVRVGSVATLPKKNLPCKAYVTVWLSQPHRGQCVDFFHLFALLTPACCPPLLPWTLDTTYIVMSVPPSHWALVDVVGLTSTDPSESFQVSLLLCKRSAGPLHEWAVASSYTRRTFFWILYP